MNPKKELLWSLRVRLRLQGPACWDTCPGRSKGLDFESPGRGLEGLLKGIYKGSIRDL